MAVDTKFLDSLVSGDFSSGLQQPSDQDASRSYLKQSDLKDIVALSNEERATDRATNENPAVKNELLKEIERAKDPVAKAALVQELKRQGGDTSYQPDPTSTKQSTPGVPRLGSMPASVTPENTRFKDYRLDNNPNFGGNAATADSGNLSVSKEIGAAIDSYQANLWAIPAAMGSDYALKAMQENKSASEQAWKESGAPQSFDEMEFGKNFGQYFAHMALQSAPYMLEFMASGFGVGSLAKTALTNTAKGVAEKAAIEAVKMGATKEAAKKAGEAAAASYMGKVYTASGVAGSYPSALGDVLSNQHEQAGKFDLPTAAALAVPYAALNAAGTEGMAVRAAARGLPKSAIAKDGIAGFAGRAALTGAEAGVMEGSTETGQEVMNQLGRMAVDPNAKIDDKRALEAYKESFIAGTLLGGVPGAATGGFRKAEDQAPAAQPPAAIPNAPLTSAVNQAQHVENQQQQVAVDDHRDQIINMLAQRDDLTERIAGLQNMIDRANPSSEDGQRVRAMQSDLMMRRDALVSQIDAAKAFYGADQMANIGPVNDPLILGSEQMARTYQVTQRLLDNPSALDPKIRSELLKGFAVLRNRTLPEATRIDAAINLISTMDVMANQRTEAAAGRADEREWNAFAEQEAASDQAAKAKAIDKSLANSGPKPLPDSEVTGMRAQLLDRVLATNPENPNRTFDRALRLEGFRDSAFTDAEKERIAQFAAMRSSPMSSNGLAPLPSQGRYQHLSDMLDAGWEPADRGQLVGPNGETYNLKGAGEAQFVRNKLNQKAGNGSQSPRGGSQGGTDQGDFGGAGANGPVPQGGGNGSGQANAIPDTGTPAGTIQSSEAVGNVGQPNNPLARSRLTALEDQRVAKYADDLRSMAPDSGWAEEGGRLLIAPDGTKSRTKWIPRAEWFVAGMLNSPQASVSAVEKAISGQPMRKAEKLHVQGMMDFLDMQYGIDGESHAEQLATLSDIAYEGESADAQSIIDTLGDVDLESIGVWGDEVESKRALGFTEEEINEITRRKQGAFGAVGEEAAGVPAGEAQGAIPEGDGNGDGQAEGQEGFSLNQQTNTEAAAEYKRQQEEAGKKDKEPEQPTVTADQGDLLNTQGSLFNSNRDGGKPTFAQFKKSPYQIKVGDTLVHDGLEYTVKYSNELGVVGERPNGEYQSTVRIFERGEELHRARYRALYGEIAKSELPDDKPGMAKRKIFRNGKSGVREVHEVDAQDVAISELPDHQFFVFKDEERGAYSLTEASTGLRVGVGETAEAAVADFESKLEKVGAETVAKHVATSPKIPGAEGAKPTAPNTQPQGQGGTPATAQQAGSAAASPAGGEFDVSKCTEPQLTYLALKGKPGWKEAAIAELQKRGVKFDAPEGSASDATAKQPEAKAGQQEESVAGSYLQTPLNVSWKSGKYDFAETVTFEHRSDDGRLSKTIVDEDGNKKKYWLVETVDGDFVWKEAAGGKESYVKFNEDQANSFAKEDLGGKNVSRGAKADSASTVAQNDAPKQEQAAVADFESKLEKVGAETVAKHVAASPKIPGAEGAKPTAPQPAAKSSVIRAYKTKSGKIGARIEKVVGPTGKVFYNYTGEWGAGSGHALAQMDKIESMWRKEKRGYTVVEAEAAAKPVAESAPSPVDTSMRDRGAEAFKDGLPRTAPEGIKGADKVRWMTGYDDAKKTSETPKQKTDTSQEPKAIDTKPESDWLGELFGSDSSQMQPVEQNKNKKVDLSGLVGKLREFSDKKLAEANDWASRQYKQNKTKVSFEGDGPTRNESMSISAANESRRNRNVDSLQHQAQMASNLANRIERGFDVQEEIEQAIRNAESDIKRDGKARFGGTRESQIEAYISNSMLGDASYGFGEGTLPSLIRKAYEQSQQKTDSAKKGQEQAAPVSQPKNDKPAYADDAELQDALSHLGDVLGDVFGAKLNITGKQYGASDLLPAMSKVIELLIKKGFKSFRESVGAATNAMRGNANTKGFVDQITPRQWKAAYNSVAEFHEGTESEEDVAKYSAEQIQKIIALPEKIKEAEQATNHDATPGQKEAGNYAKGKFAWQGLNIAVETAKGEDRTDKETNGDKWRVKMPATYGYIVSAYKGADGDHVDVFMGDKPESQRVYVINQTKPGSTEFDEHKVMLGYDSEGAAIGDYLLSFSETFGGSVLGSVSGPYAIDDFKHMLESNRFGQSKPISDRLAYVNPRVEENTAEQQPPGVTANGAKEKAAAERLAQLLDKMDQVRIDRNTPEGSAKGIIRSVIEELRKERSVGNIPGLLDTAAQRLFRQHSAFSDVVSEVAESLRAADKYAETVAKVKAKQEERNTPTLDKITVTRSATLDGKAVEYDQQADEALKEIDSNMDLAKRLLECLAA